MFSNNIYVVIFQTILVLRNHFIAQNYPFKDITIYEDLLKANAGYRSSDSLFIKNDYQSDIFSTFLHKIQNIEKSGCGNKPDHCPKTGYRSYDGSCNNLNNPTWGTPNTPYNRLIPPIYADGIMDPPLSRNGKPLPLARSVSLLLYPDVPIEDHKFTVNLMQYGQIITHDLSMTAGNTQTEHYKTRCCTDDGQLLDSSKMPAHCYPMIMPSDDPAHSHDNTKCMSFDRTLTNKDRNCNARTHTAEQLTSVNHYLDLSFVYGNDDETNHQLREFKGGRLRSDTRKGQQWPPRAMNASATCRLIKPKDSCYFAGDTRINQNPQLALLHVIFLREHNRISNTLSSINAHWDDEVLFQEARKINIAQHQHITYYEWLPNLIGKENALKTNVVWETHGFVRDYNENVDATVLNEYSTGAIRHLHSLIVGKLYLITENRHLHGTVRFSDVLRRPQILEQKKGFDNLIRGLTTQLQSASDQFHDSEVTQFLFRNDNETFGIDLKAFDIQRSRDHGLGSYNDYRELWNIPRAISFEDFLDHISLENVNKLAKLYENPDDVDLVVGGSLEKNIFGTLLGPTFRGIVIEQFYRTRVGDRFWFENPDTNGFTLKQLQEIRKSSISRLLCDNGHSIKNMQVRSFEKLSFSNPLIPCHNLPLVDLSLWKDTHNYEEYTSIKQNVFPFK